MKKNTRIILALDVISKDKALQITKDLQNNVDAIKVGYPLVLGAGLDIITELSKFCPVIADFKVADIPNTDKLICEQVFEAGADAIIVQAFTGRDSLEMCVNVAKAYNKEVYAVTEMSHPGAIDFMADAAEKMAHMASDVKVTGVVAPATRPARVKFIRDIIGNDISIISPGVGTQGGIAADVIAAGADWVIVGRSIYQADNPKTEAIKIATEIENI